MINRIEIKANARQQINGKIGLLFVVNLIVYGLNWLCSIFPLGGALVSSVFLAPALTAGIIMIYFKVSDGEDFKIGDVFDGFYHFWSVFKITFLMGLFAALWVIVPYTLVIIGAAAKLPELTLASVLVLLVAEIIMTVKILSYSMSLYIWADNKSIGALDAIRQSKRMMHGHKMDYFVLGLSFLGWILLCVITLGLALIYVEPYMQTAYINFYKAIRPAKKEEPVSEAAPVVEDAPVEEAPVIEEAPAEEEKTEE